MAGDGGYQVHIEPCMDVGEVLVLLSKISPVAHNVQVARFIALNINFSFMYLGSPPFNFDIAGNSGTPRALRYQVTRGLCLGWIQPPSQQ